MKILILMAYYNRPRMVEIALNSIKNQGYKNWQLAFVDDGSEFPGEPIVREILSEEIDKVIFFNTNHTAQDKINNGGSHFAGYWNTAMRMSNADIAIMLCDDDALYPDYLFNLSEYYKLNENIIYSYGHVSVFDPNKFNGFNNLSLNRDSSLNHTSPINPYCMVDASQVSWRIKNVLEKNIAFPTPKTSDLDAQLYGQLFNHFGNCVYNGIIAQYKGVHTDQLGKRTVDMYEVKDIK